MRELNFNVGRHSASLRRGQLRPQNLRRLSLACLLSLSTLWGCGESTEVAQEGPIVEATSEAAVVVGQTLEFYGRNFLKSAEGSSQLLFQGTFRDQYGRESEVDINVTPFFGGQEIGEDGRHILTWSRFGPFRNPFTGDARHGLFQGSVRVMNYHDDGTVEEGPE